MLEFRDKLTPEERVAIAKASIMDITVRGDARFFVELETLQRDNVSNDKGFAFIKSEEDARMEYFRQEYTNAGMSAKDVDFRVYAQDIIFQVEVQQFAHGGVAKTKISKEAARLICGTRLQVEPGDLIPLLREHPVYLEGEPLLYDNVANVMLAVDGWDDIIFLLEMVVGEQFCSLRGGLALNDIDWKADIIDFDLARARTERLSHDEYVSQVIKAVTYILRYILLRDAQKTPVEVETRNYDGSRIKGPSHGRSYIPQKYVSLTKEYIRARKDYETGVRGELDKYGKHLKPVEIAGFVRMQAYGEGHKLRRPQFIPGFASSRWENDGIKIINVKP